MKRYSQFLFATLLLGGELIAEVPRFDADNSFRLLEKQCHFGPRNPGSPGHKACKEWLEEQLASSGGEVTTQRFTGFNPHAGESVELFNIIARFQGLSDDPLMLCAHWDTRPVADREPEFEKQKLPIPGANDGASGVAVLLEIARHLGENPPPRTVLIVLFDGEDLGREGHASEYAQGSRFWALHPIPEKPQEAILLDMIGDADLEIKVEYFSERNASSLRRSIWRIAGDLGIKAFRDLPGPAVEDDHVPLIKAGIRAIDVIDFEYPWWHTLHDTPDKCSPESLDMVGRVIMQYIYR